MNSIFLKIYGGLICAIVVVAILSGIVLSFTNDIRLQSYRMAAAKGPLKVLANQLQIMNNRQRKRQLTRWSDQFDIPLSIINAKDSDLPDRVLFKLRRGDIYAEFFSNRNFKIYAYIRGDQLLSAVITNLPNQVIANTISIVKDWLMTVPPRTRKTLLSLTTENIFDVPITILNTQDMSFFDKKNRQPYVLQHDDPIFLQQQGRRMTFYTQFQDTHQWLKFGPVSLMNLYPFQLIIALVVFIITAVSFAIYLLVKDVELRLRKMDIAARKIASGHLNARAEIKGDDPIGQLASGFNLMASQIQRLLDMQKEMIQGISHELRTPLARMRFALEMIACAKSEKAQEDYINSMDQDITELDRLIDEFLTYARLEQHSFTIKFSSESITDVVDQVIIGHSRSHDKIHIDHSINLGETNDLVDMERRYMYRAIQNIVGNACRHAEQKVSITTTISNLICSISIEDDGEGIPKSERERIFSVFVRLDDSRARTSGGYGLGLSIVKRIIEWHDGKVYVSKSKMLEGAKFTLEWPRYQKMHQITISKGAYNHSPSQQ